MAAPLLGRTLGGLREPWSDRSQGSLLLAPQVMRRSVGNAALFFACDEEMKSPRGRLSRAGARCPTSHLGGFRSGSDYLVPHVVGKVELMSFQLKTRPGPCRMRAVAAIAFSVLAASTTFAAERIVTL